MKHKHYRLRMVVFLAGLAVATLALPLPTHAGVRVSIGISVPIYPAPVIVAPPPVVVYPAPPVVGTGYYGYYRPLRRYWGPHHPRGFYGYQPGYGRHHPRRPHHW